MITEVDYDKQFCKIPEVFDKMNEIIRALNTMESANTSYNSVRDAIAPDCLHCRVHGHCSCSLNSDCCKHLFWCNKHP